MDLTRRVKQLEIALFIICIILCGFIVYSLWPSGKPTFSDERGLDAQIILMKERDRQRDSTIQALESRIQQDSIRISAVKVQVDDVPAMILRINKRYDDKRNHIITLSADEQLQLFSEWLSTQGSL